MTSIGFGAVGAFLALAVVGATTSESHILPAAYIAMAIVTWEVLVPLAVASLATGLVQSISTPWGLVRYYWLIIKEILSLIAFAVLMLRTQTVDALSKAALAGADLGAMEQDRMSMIVHGAGGLAVLLIVVVLSVYKPRGMTRHGMAAIRVS